MFQVNIFFSYPLKTEHLVFVHEKKKEDVKNSFISTTERREKTFAPNLALNKLERIN